MGGMDGGMAFMLLRPKPATSGPAPSILSLPFPQGKSWGFSNKSADVFFPLKTASKGNRDLKIESRDLLKLRVHVHPTLSLFVQTLLKARSLPDAAPRGLRPCGVAAWGDSREPSEQAILSRLLSPWLCPWSDVRGPVPHSPEAAGVGLAQDTVVGRGEGVKPEVRKALVGIRLRGGRALKSVVAGGGGNSSQETGLGGGLTARACDAPICGDTQEGHTALSSLKIRVSHIPGEKGCRGNSGN